MTLVYLVLFAVVLVVPYTRCMLFHLPSTLYYACMDVYKYYRYKKYNMPRTGTITAYCGLFGRGKTLSAVHHVVSQFRKYNGKTVYCPQRKKFVKLRVNIISNVELVGIPYERFVSLEQIIKQAENREAYDFAHDCLTVTFVLGDEFSVQLNSRNFKKNIDPLFLNTLLTCRHHYIALDYTAQRFNQVDALLRQVTSEVYDCRKWWRLMYHKVFDAWDMENCSNVQNLKSLRSDIWFIRNRDFSVYDTLACVKNLSDSYKHGDMLKPEEILALQCNQPSDVDAVQHKSFKLKRRLRKSS